MDDLRILVHLPEDPMEDIPLELYMLLMGQVQLGEELFYLFCRLFPLFMRWRRDLRHSWYNQYAMHQDCNPRQVHDL